MNTQVLPECLLIARCFISWSFEVAASFDGWFTTAPTFLLERLLKSAPKRTHTFPQRWMKNKLKQGASTCAQARKNFQTLIALPCASDRRRSTISSNKLDKFRFERWEREKSSDVRGRPERTQRKNQVLSDQRECRFLSFTDCRRSLFLDTHITQLTIKSDANCVVGRRLVMRFVDWWCWRPTCGR